MKKERGFTIVELLIVIVVIAILAAIVIVAYNGVQQRANTSAALSAANIVVKKAEAANAVANSYPSAAADFAANNESTIAGQGVSIGTPTAANGRTTVSYQKCTAGSSGAKIAYWDYGSGGISSAANSKYVGDMGSAGVNCTTLGATLTIAG